MATTSIQNPIVTPNLGILLLICVQFLILSDRIELTAGLKLRHIRRLDDKLKEQNARGLMGNVVDKKKKGGIKTFTQFPSNNNVEEEDPFIKKTIVNPHDFTYILNPGDEICRKTKDGSPIFLLIYVHSAPRNFKRRLSLRETWARRSMFRDMRIVFMMGNVAESDDETQELLKLEYELYKDIVQETFEDAYKNLTYKGIMSMKWISQYCKTSKYILKVDDDIISNIFILFRHLFSIDRHKVVHNNTIMCLVWDGMVIRSFSFLFWCVV